MENLLDRLIIIDSCSKNNIDNIKLGLYIFVFKNNFNLDIYDNNKNNEKIVINKSGVSVKFGKFEKGFKTRLENYKNHLHIKSPNSKNKEFVFDQSFYFGFIFDTSNLFKNEDLISSKIFEPYWNEMIKIKLKELNVLNLENQKKRSEWVHIKTDVNLDFLKNELNNSFIKLTGHLYQIAEFINQNKKT